MKMLITAVLLSIACLAFAGCGWSPATGSKEDFDRDTREGLKYLMSDGPVIKGRIQNRYNHTDYLEYVDEFTRRIHVSNCKRWNYNWDPLPYEYANVWQERSNDEAAKPAHKRDYAKAMTDPDTGIRYEIGGWMKSGGVITGWCCGT